MTDQEKFDAALIRALPELGARLEIDGNSNLREDHLERALVAALEATEPGSSGESAGHSRIAVPDWDRRMGGFDVRMRLPDAATEALVEAKVDDVGQVLWDLFKLAAGLTLTGIGAGYLLVARAEASWSRGECAELFSPTDVPVRWSSAPMFRNWRKAWEWLLKGGSARPLSVPDRIETFLLGRAPTSGCLDYEVRAVSVRLIPGAGRLLFDGDWPAKG